MALEDITTMVFKNYGIRVKRVTREKSQIVIDTESGHFRVARTTDSPQRLEFAHYVKEMAARKGFERTDRFVPTVAGQPYMTAADGLYTISPRLEGREADFKAAKQAAHAAATIARFHTAAQDEILPENFFLCEDRSLKRLERGKAELISFKKTVQSQKRTSDFDVLFLRNYEFYLKMANEALAILQSHDYIKRTEDAEDKGRICHVLVKEENFLLKGDVSSLTGFSQAACGEQLNDLAKLILRCFKAKGAGDGLKAVHIAEAYNAVKPLSKEDGQILYALTIYPHRFLKICGQYYLKRRTFTPSAITDRMEGEIARKGDFPGFIEGLL